MNTRYRWELDVNPRRGLATFVEFWTLQVTCVSPSMRRHLPQRRASVQRVWQVGTFRSSSTHYEIRLSLTKLCGVNKAPLKLPGSVQCAPHSFGVDSPLLIGGSASRHGFIAKPPCCLVNTIFRCRMCSLSDTASHAMSVPFRRGKYPVCVPSNTLFSPNFVLCVEATVQMSDGVKPFHLVTFADSKSQHTAHDQRVD